MGLLQIIKNVCYAVADSIKGGTQGKPRLIMTLLVKNEEKLLEKNLLFHKAMGVDAFIVTDNNSTDSTPAIIQKYVEMGWIVESFIERGTDYRQKEWVGRMIWSAKQRHAADWVINADADEMWYSSLGDLKAEMLGRVNVLRCKVVNVFPQEGLDFWEWNEMIKPIDNTSVYDLSPYNIYQRYTYKVAHSAYGYIKISMGNHKVTMLPKRQKESDITVFHYNNISREQFIAKMKNGGKQMEQNPKKSVARHWRYFYELYKEGRIEEEYDRVVGTKWQEEFREKGYIYQDNSVAEVFAKINLPK